MKIIGWLGWVGIVAVAACGGSSDSTTSSTGPSAGAGGGTAGTAAAGKAGAAGSTSGAGGASAGAAGSTSGAGGASAGAAGATAGAGGSAAGAGGSTAGAGGASAGAAGATAGSGGSVAGAGGSSAGAGGVSAGAGGSAGAATAKAECEKDEDCFLQADCCACAGVPSPGPACALACALDRCAPLQLKAKCAAGRCVTSANCDESQVQCKAAAPDCEKGKTPTVDPATGCWGPCIAVEECASVPDCKRCDDAGQLCVSYSSKIQQPPHCVPLPKPCDKPSCECVGPSVCDGVFSVCNADDTHLSCQCPTCG